ncbi:hypothetical protein BCR43DRAFT_518920 [Syncephalastrum racemosum]|uniref:Uncharacterized protein n=1 Tax=Syncephalastrum racemosum TaxID=13706 RepID=A0A1X2H060_SYNRA|nr:hypothetical protein BCR43DRAFT_518920 [Syncephalastrum racemosum]
MRSNLFLIATTAICLPGAVFAQGTSSNPDELQATGSEPQAVSGPQAGAGPDIHSSALNVLFRNTPLLVPPATPDAVSEMPPEVFQGLGIVPDRGPGLPQ